MMANRQIYCRTGLRHVCLLYRCPAGMPLQTLRRDHLLQRSHPCDAFCVGGAQGSAAVKLDETVDRQNERPHGGGRG